ncbi:hypothetical protein ADUPG1_009613 [Aduncisulcus paluster]|uniref:Uncharacterized protein n=1 Tax=Aduncisulcus paluster TaxID=2918883 RepID=A0ABQ5L034_9EUKA|nr:hypothetical protein ADUPG1_009613 [Aduncisulcus paluster]
MDIDNDVEDFSDIDTDFESAVSAYIRAATGLTTKVDVSGIQHYRTACRKLEILPSSSVEQELRSVDRQGGKKTDFNFRSVYLGPEGGKSIAEVLQIVDMKKINFSGCALFGEGVEAVVQGVLKKDDVEDLDFSDNSFGKDHKLQPFTQEQLDALKVEEERKKARKREIAKLLKKNPRMKPEDFDKPAGGDDPDDIGAAIDVSGIQHYRTACRKLEILPSSSVEQELRSVDRQGGKKTDFNFRSVYLGPEGGKSIAEVLQIVDMKKINFSGCALFGEGVEAVVQGVLKKDDVEDLDFSDNSFGKDHKLQPFTQEQLDALKVEEEERKKARKREIAKLLKKNPRMKPEDFDKPAGGDDPDDIGAAIKKDFHEFQVTCESQGVRAISLLVNQCRSLKALKISRNGINDAGAIQIMESCDHAGRLTSIDLSHNELSDKSFEIILKTLQELVVSSISLNNNKIRGLCCSSLLKHVRYLTTIDLSTNPLEDDGGMSVLKCLIPGTPWFCETLTKLSLSECGLKKGSAECLKAIISSNSSPSLEIDVSKNPFKLADMNTICEAVIQRGGIPTYDEEGNMVASAVPKHEPLAALALQGITITYDDYSTITRACEAYDGADKAGVGVIALYVDAPSAVARDPHEFDDLETEEKEANKEPPKKGKKSRKGK